MKYLLILLLLSSIAKAEVGVVVPDSDNYYMLQQRKAQLEIRLENNYYDDKDSEIRANQEIEELTIKIENLVDEEDKQAEQRVDEPKEETQKYSKDE